MAQRSMIGPDAGGWASRSVPSPLGTLLLGATPRGVCLCEFHDRRALPTEMADLERRFGPPALGVAPAGPAAHLDLLEAELAAYFAGTLRAFTVALDTPGTPFERSVWDALLAIPHGETRSYGDVARRLGNAGASRAVGRANGANRVSIVVPCHRVIESTGALRGYGGGLDRKRWLLDHERSGSEITAAACSLWASAAAAGVPD